MNVLLYTYIRCMYILHHCKNTICSSIDMRKEIRKKGWGHSMVNYIGA